MHRAKFALRNEKTDSNEFSVVKIKGVLDSLAGNLVINSEE